MTDYEEIIYTALVSFGCGVTAAVLIDKWRDRRALRMSVLQTYLNFVVKDQVESDEYLRFAALQKSGAWRLNGRELKDLAEEVCGRGYRHPYEAWRGAFPQMGDFPREFLLWAKSQNLDLGDSDTAVRKIAEVYDAQSIPRPSGPGFSFV